MTTTRHLLIPAPPHPVRCTNCDMQRGGGTNQYNRQEPLICRYGMPSWGRTPLEEHEEWHGPFQRPTHLYTPMRLPECLAAERAAREQTEELARLRSRVAELEARLAALEAPPVVPVGYQVEKVDHQVDRAEYLPRWELWCMTYYGEGPVTVAHVYIDSRGSKNLATSREYDCEPMAALRALWWASEHDQRPPHAGDGKVER